MSHLTAANDRKRRRQARRLTFIITALTLGGVAYGMGAVEGLPEMIQQLMHSAPAAVPVA